MAWIEVHQTLPRHRKTFHLAAELGIARVQAVGHMVSLWLWAIDNAPSGALTGMPAAVIAFAAEWDGDPAAFLDGLVASGFVAADGDEMVINDWHEYAGKLIERREMERERSAARRRAGAPHDDHPATAGRPAVDRATTNGTVPNSTVPNPTYVSASAETPPAASGDVPKPIAQALFDVLVARFGAPANKDERGKYNRAVKMLAEAGCDAAEANHLISEAEARWSGIDITPLGVAGNVTTLRRPARSPPKNGRVEGAVDQIRRLAGRGSTA